METVARQLAEAWQDRGHTVHVVTQTPLGDAEPLDEVPVTRRPALGQWWTLLRDAELFVQSGISLKSLPLGLASGTPIVFVHHNMLPLTPDTVGARMLLKRGAAHLGQNVAVSTAVARNLPDRKTTVIHNPFVPSFEGTQPPESETALLFVGRLVSVKGVDVALRALSELDPAYTLTICGDGDEREVLQTLAQRLGIDDRVSFEGWVDHNEIADYARRASLQLVPSRYEPFGIVALEAIAAGCPVVASDTGGLPEAVGKCGVLVPPDDPEALAHGIERAVEQREELLRHREAHLEQFDIDTIADQYLNVFRRVLHSSNAG
jgi:glycosyltransferase involved in cell wall biosynthesis